jgi:chromosome segregation ATPase
MSRSKKRTTDELESLRAENRELRSTIKSLLRQIRKLEKEYKPEHSQDVLIKEEIKEKVPKCPECGRGRIKNTELGVRLLISCTHCKYSKVTKNG